MGRTSLFEDLGHLEIKDSSTSEGQNGDAQK